MLEIITIKEAIDYLMSLANKKRSLLSWICFWRWRNLYMPGDPRYQPEKLKRLLGYDQWAGLLVIIEWFWLLVLAEAGEIPKKYFKYLTKEKLFELLRKVTTTKQDKKEKITKHDILALLAIMRKYLPKPLHRYLHFGPTSYDIIETAYALQLRFVFTEIIWPELLKIDKIWRQKIKENAEVLQDGRTHLQKALPITVGFWLATLHSRFINCCLNLYKAAMLVQGKFNGAVGTSASIRTLFGEEKAEKYAQRLMEMLGLPLLKITTQIIPPENRKNFYDWLVSLSGVFANLADDTRILQGPYKEIVSPSSTSSTMSHKDGNPVTAEQVAGMHATAIAESLKLLLTLISNLQRDLRGSSVMRSFSAVIVYVFQQITKVGELLNNLTVNKEKCLENFKDKANLVVAEPLHLFLQINGFPEAHSFINKIIVPLAAKKKQNLVETMNGYLAQESLFSWPEFKKPIKLLKKILRVSKLKKIWQTLPDNVKVVLEHPDQYLGNAVKIAKEEANNELKKPE